MTCKNCIHYKVCKAIFSIVLNEKLAEKIIGNADDCEFFEKREKKQ